jgi:hypothetical protein
MSDQLTHIIPGVAQRLGCIMLLGSVLTAGPATNAAARDHRGHAHVRPQIADVHAELIPQEPVRPPVMRYYGGPKSPMWREVR